MTDRLYYDDSYLTDFDAEVVSCQQAEGGYLVALDRTAFYPTSGGQPCDTGMLGCARVLDVNVDKRGAVLHLCDRPVAGAVRGRIDWDRRFDHMQQHAADHLVAGYIHRLYGGFTVGLHLGRELSTIDVVMPDGALKLTDDQVAELERLCNRDIQRDLPVRCFFPDAAEMAQLPLRKDPTVDEHVRVVLIGEAECVACGGTHVSSAGQIGVLKILWTAPARGKLRLAFAAGMRAVEDYRARFSATEAACALLSCQPDGLADAVRAALEKHRAAEAELARLKREAGLRRADGLLRAARARDDGWRVVSANMPELDMDALKELGKRLIEEARVIALLSCGNQLLFARSAGDGPDMGRLVKDAAAQFGGRGGGRPDFAQGSATDGARAVAWACEMTA